MVTKTGLTLICPMLKTYLIHRSTVSLRSVEMVVDKWSLLPLHTAPCSFMPAAHTTVCIWLFLFHYSYEHLSSTSSSQCQLYSVIFCFCTDPSCTSRMWLWMTTLALCSIFVLITTEVVYLQKMIGCFMAGAMWNWCCLGARSVYTV